MKPKKWLNLVGLLVILSMLLTACGADPTATPAPEPTATTAVGGSQGEASATAAPGGEATKAPGGSTQGAKEGVFRYRLAAAPENLDPQAMSFVDEIGTGELVFEGLMALNDKLEPEPAAAEKMEVSDDGLKYTLTLRDDLKYSDGEPLTAKNFEYAWHRLFDPRVPNRQYSFVAYDIAGAEELDSTPVTDTAKIEEGMKNLGVKALDDKTIEFTLKNKAAYFPYILTLWTGWPSRQDLVEEGGEQWTIDPDGKYYVGNGPFILKEYNGEQGMKFVPNPNYRKGAPKIQELEAKIINDTAVAFLAYKNGELDAIQVAAEDFATAQGDPELKNELTEVPGSCNFYVGFNTQKAPFDNMKVRQAFAQALDREDYQMNVEKGLGQAAQSFIPPDRPGYAPDIDTWKFDPEAAKATLAEAGFANGEGLPPIKLTYSSSPRRKTRMEWVQNQIKTNLGIEMELDPIDPTAYTALVKDPSTTPQVFFLGWCQDYPDPQDWLTLVFHSDSTVTHVGWKNEEFDRLVKAADIEQDPAKREEMYHQAHEILVEEAPAVFLYWDETPWLIKSYVKGAKENINPQDHNVPGFFNVTNIEVSP